MGEDEGEEEEDGKLMLVRKILPAANQRPAERNDLSQKLQTTQLHVSDLLLLLQLSSPHPPLLLLFHLLSSHHGFRQIGHAAGRQPPLPLHASGLDRKLLFLCVPRSHPSGTPSSQLPSAPA